MENQSRFKTFIGIVLMPILASIFIFDRIILVFLPHVNGVAIQDFFFNKEEIVRTMLRMIAITIGCVLYFIYKLIF